MPSVTSPVRTAAASLTAAPAAVRRTGALLVCASAVVGAWACWLAATLPSVAAHAWSVGGALLGNWQLTWTGLDGLEAVALLVTGLALRRGHWFATVSALVGLPLFLLDAWWDVLTATSRAELWEAALMAVFLELPTACLLGWVALPGVRALRGDTSSADERRTGGPDS